MRQLEIVLDYPRPLRIDYLILCRGALVPWLWRHGQWPPSCLTRGLGLCGAAFADWQACMSRLAAAGTEVGAARVARPSRARRLVADSILVPQRRHGRPVRP